MRGLRYILILLFIVCYRGLSAQEFDLYDFRYYKRFDTVEELLAPETDSVEVAKFVLNRNFSTRALEYNFSSIRFARRGISQYRHRTTLDGLEIPFLSHSTIRALQLEEERKSNFSQLRIDSLKEIKTSAGFTFSSRNMPYSISLATAQKFRNGWSLATNLIARTGRDLFVEGLFGNSLELNAMASKTWKDKHTLSMALFMKPSMRGTRLASTAEAFRLTGNNLYNPAWGYQNGKVRNSRIRREVLPTAFVDYDVKLNESTKLNVSMVLTAGIEEYSSLEWFDAHTPSPDNYRYMPSYFGDEEDIFHAVESAWLNNDTRYTQIDFDKLIATNRLNGDKAVYAISDRVQRTIDAAFRGGGTTTINKSTISYGLEIGSYNCRSYKQMRDLLGGSYILDLDYFLRDDDTYGNSLQNNLENVNHRVEEGERFGYDYAIRKFNVSAFTTYHYSAERFTLDFAAKVGYDKILREGFYKKELFADNSFGESRSLKFSPYSARLRAGYLIADNHYVEVVASAESASCDVENLFLQSQYNNRIVDNPTMRSVYRGGMRYSFQMKDFALNTTLFISSELNDTQVRHLYDDIWGEYADIVINRINRLCYGLEVEADYSFANHFRANAALSVGRYSYAKNPLVTIYTDTDNTLLANRIESHIKGLPLGNMPQVAATIGLSYYNRGWWVAVNANYAGLRYIEPSIVMRTERVFAMATSQEQRSAMTEHERLKDMFTIDVSLSKSIYLKHLSRRIYSTKAVPHFEDKYPRSRLVFRVGVRNLLGSTDIVYNAYESSRLQRYKRAGENVYSRQASRYMYAYPRTFYASATFSF